MSSEQADQMLTGIQAVGTKLDTLEASQKIGLNVVQGLFVVGLVVCAALAFLAVKRR